MTISTPILVVVGHEAGEGEPTLTGSAQKAVGLASTLTDAKVYALSVEPQADLEALSSAGADVVYLPEAEGYSPRVSEHVADATRAAIRSIGDVGAVITVATYTGRAVAAMVGVTEGAGAAVDVTQVNVEDGTLTAEKSALGGTWATRFQVDRGIPVLALRPGAGEEGTPGEGQPETLAFELTGPSKAIHVEKSAAESKDGRVDPTEADVVVVAGRGVDGDMDVAYDLADLLGAGVGATRVACDEGWVERSMQIGQTGLSIAPKVYVGLGVSGQVHHTVGMLASEKIVAVVDDPDAPVVEMADFVVVGDVAVVVPQAVEELKRLQAQ